MHQPGNQPHPYYPPQTTNVYVIGQHRRKRTMHVWHWIAIILTGGMWAPFYAYIVWHRRKG